jgi:hypothetical protein
MVLARAGGDMDQSASSRDGCTVEAELIELLMLSTGRMRKGKYGQTVMLFTKKGNSRSEQVKGEIKSCILRCLCTQQVEMPRRQPGT